MDIVNEYMNDYAADADITPEWAVVKESMIRAGLAVMEKQGASPETATTEHIRKTLAAIRKLDRSQNYKRNVFIHFRAFAVWLAEKNHKIDPTKFADAELPSAQLKTKRPEDLLSWEEVVQVINACDNARDRALISMLYDGSNRPIELLSLTWGDLNIDEFGMWFVTNRKTAKSRTIRLTNISIPYISAWKSEYPGKPEGDAPIFISRYRRNGGAPIPLTSRTTEQLIDRLRKRTGIQKLKPSIFRPSRITSDVRDGYDLPYIMLKNWGHLKTTMIDTYTALSQDYTDSVALRMAGMKHPIEQSKPKGLSKMEPRECPICKTYHPPAAQFCNLCGRPLTTEAEETVNQVEDLTNQKLNEILSNPAKSQKLKQMLQELMATE